MEKLEWQPAYNTGIQEIDTQHRQIVDYLNQLHEANINADIQAVGEVLEGMVDYTLTHFAFEESLMEQIDYPFASAHKNVHTMFVKRVSQFHEKFKNGENIIDELHALLRRWLINHIQRDDAAYVRPFNAHLESLKPSEIQAPRPEENTQPTGNWLTKTLRKFFG